MTNGSAFQKLTIYALALPLALLLGWVLAADSPVLDLRVWFVLGSIITIIAAPLILQHYHVWLFFSWNMLTVVFFLPGRPPLWMLLAFAGLGLAILQRTLNKEVKFLHASMVLAPTLVLVAVVFGTAYFTGSFGLASLGGESVGGRGYWYIFGSAAGMLAMVSQQIPQDKVKLYTGLFFLGTLTAAFSSAFSLLPNAAWKVRYLFLLFPVESLPGASGQQEVSRLWGTSIAGSGIFIYILARYGIKDLFEFRNFWRLLVLVGAFVLTLAGGFRSLLILMLLVFAIVFYLEGLVRSKYGAVFLFIGVISGLLLIPFANRLPLSIQRAISFLPVEISPVARYNAQVSTEWRLAMWKAVKPLVWENGPGLYFWGGKGLGVAAQDLELTADLVRKGLMRTEEEAILAGSYHNGPLSVMIPFGVWGAIAVLWFFYAGVKALNRNRLYGDEHLRKINTLLLAYFVAKIILFMTVFGEIRTDFPIFAGLLGLSVALNGGVRRPLRVAEAAVNLPLGSTRMAEIPAGGYSR